MGRHTPTYFDTSDWPAAVGHAEFTTLVASHIPEVHTRMIELDALGLLHVEMGVLEEMTIQAYNDRLNVARRYLAFADVVLARADAAVLNALDVSFVEGLVFGGCDEGIRDWMPERLQKAYDSQAIRAPMAIADRIVGAILFGGAAALFWPAAWMVTNDLEIITFGAVASIPSACLFGALAAPRMAAKAIVGTKASQSWLAGVWTTSKAYALSAVLIAVFVAFDMSGDVLHQLQSDPVGSLLAAPGFVLGIGILSAVAAMIGIPFLIPSLAVGASAGRLFHAYASRRRIDLD